MSTSCGYDAQKVGTFGKTNTSEDGAVLHYAALPLASLMMCLVAISFDTNSSKTRCLIYEVCMTFAEYFIQ